MPTPISGGTPDPRNFIDDPGDTSYKWGGPGSPGRGSNLGPAGLSLGAGGGGYGPGGGGAVAFGTNPFMRRKLRMGPTAGAGQMQYGGPGVDPSQFGYSQPMQGGGGGAPMGVKSGASPQMNRGRWDTIQRIRDTMQQNPGWQPGQPAPGGPGGQVPAPPNGGQGYLEDAINRLRTPGAANQHDMMNLLTWLAMGGQSPLLQGSVLDPRGTAAGQEMRRQEADRTRTALQRRSRLAAQSRGDMLDPSQRGFADFFSEIGTNAGLGEANALSEAQAARDYEDFLRQFMASQGGYGFQRGLNEQNSLLAGRYQPKQPSGIPGLIGQIGGSAIGGWTRPGGWLDFS